MKRRNFLSTVCAILVSCGIKIKASPMDASRPVPSWTLRDLQYGADSLYQTHGMMVDTIVCSYANRRHILRLADAEWTTSAPYRIIVSEGRLTSEGCCFMLDTKHSMHPLMLYHPATRTFD